MRATGIDHFDPSYKDIPFLPQSLITNPDEVNTSSYVVRKETSKNGIWTTFTTTCAASER